MLGPSSGSAEEQSARQSVGPRRGAAKGRSSLESKTVDTVPSIELTERLSFAWAGDVQKTAKPVKKTRKMTLVVDIN
jgi:hypothetical protein